MAGVDDVGPACSADAAGRSTASSVDWSSGRSTTGCTCWGCPIQGQLISTGLVLLAAVSVDSLSRPAAGSGSIART